MLGCAAILITCGGGALAVGGGYSHPGPPVGPVGWYPGQPGWPGYIRADQASQAMPGRQGQPGQSGYPNQPGQPRQPGQSAGPAKTAIPGATSAATGKPLLGEGILAVVLLLLGASGLAFARRRRADR